MTLTGKQRRALKARGQTMGDDLHLGQAGLSDAFVAHLDALLKRRELVKLRFEELTGKARQALADEVCAKVGAQCVGIVGRTMLLYREAEG